MCGYFSTVMIERVLGDGARARALSHSDFTS